MTAAHFQAPDAPGFRLDPRVIGAFARFGGGYWRGENAIRAWTLTIGLAVALLLSTAATVALNQWNRWFFDALERRDVESVTQAAFVFAVIIAAMAAIGVLIVLARDTLQVRWRAWIVEHLVDRWLGERRFYRRGSGALGHAHGTRLHRLGCSRLRHTGRRPDAVGRRAAGRLRRPQERSGGLLSLCHDAYS